MNLLSDEMNSAVDQTSGGGADKNIIKAILYQERINKERLWDKDAIKFLVETINSRDESKNNDE